MWLFICLLLSSPTFLCHLLIALAIIGSVLCYKIFAPNQLDRRQLQLHLTDRIKLAMERTRRRRQLNSQQNLLSSPNNAKRGIGSIATLAMLVLLAPMVAFCLEQVSFTIEMVNFLLLCTSSRCNQLTTKRLISPGRPID